MRCGARRETESRSGHGKIKGVPKPQQNGQADLHPLSSARDHHGASPASLTPTVLLCPLTSPDFPPPTPSQDPNLEAIKQKRLAELGGQPGGMPASAEEQEQQNAKAEQQAENRGMALASLMDPKARERLSRIAIVKPEKAQALENMILQAAQRGQLGGKVTEDSLIKMLEQINGGDGGGGGRGGPKIEMKRRNIMDDDDW